MSEAGSLSALVEALRRHPDSAPRSFTSSACRAPQPPSASSTRRCAGSPPRWPRARRAPPEPQVEGIAALRKGENVLVTTPTASGKSLVFHLPVLAEAARQGPGRALFLYPLKALGQDQRGKIEALAAAAGIDLDCAIYDGDTSPAARARLRRRPPRVMITNPDMLHLGILPSWTTWAPLLADLRWVVVDELHTYRGSSAALPHVLQRLLRICRELGGAPQLVASSATAATPRSSPPRSPASPSTASPSRARREPTAGC